MPMIQFIPHIAPWEKYFTEQADFQLRKTDKQQLNRKIYQDASVKGGIFTASSSPNYLTKVASVKEPNGERENFPEIEVNMTSPAEVTKQQAIAELDMISEDQPELSHISRETTKRAASTSGESAKPPVKKRARSESKGKAFEFYKDIFSQTTGQ